MAPALLVAITWLAYAPCLSGGFIWDDNSYVLHNPLLRDGAGLWRIWLEPSASPQYHPLVFTTFWLEYQAWGASTFGYHAVNLALHSADALLCWTVLRRLEVPGALLAAGVFALHPVHVESVAWISERKDVLSTFLYGLSMLAWLRFLRHRRERDWLGALALGAGALLAKSVLCTLPAGLALVACWKAPRLWRLWGLRLVPFVAVSVPIAALTVWREHAHGNPALPYGLVERVLIAARALWAQVAALVWPVDLTIAYAHWDVSTGDPLAYLPLLAWVAVLAALLALRPRCGDGPLVGVGFFVVTLAPMLGFVDFNIMRYAFVADHFQYLAGVGLIALAAAGAERATSAWPAAGRAAVAAALLSVLAAGTWRQAGLWIDADTMWTDNLAKNPRSWSAWSYFAKARMRGNDLAEAEAILGRAVEAMPDHAEARRTLGVVVASRGRNDEAAEHLRRAVDLDPANALARSNLGAVLMSLGRVSEAVPHLDAAVELKPEDADAWRYRAIAASQLGRRAQAIADLEQALRLRPEHAGARADLEALRAMP